MKILLSVLLLTIVSGCSVHEAPTNQAGSYANHHECRVDNQTMPQWVCSPQAKDYTAVGMGMAERNNKDFGFTRNMALLRARTDMATKLETLVEADLRYIDESIGSQLGGNAVQREVSRNLVRTTLIGAEQLDLFTNEEGDVYVLVGLAFDKYKHLVRQMAQQAYAQQYQHRAQKRASQLTDEMEKALDDWEERKSPDSSEPPLVRQKPNESTIANDLSKNQG